MGQAKRRGSFEERREAAIVRDQERAEAIRILREAQEESMPTRQVKSPALAGMILASVMSMAEAGYMTYFPVRPHGRMGSRSR